MSESGRFEAADTGRASDVIDESVFPDQSIHPRDHSIAVSHAGIDLLSEVGLTSNLWTGWRVGKCLVHTRGDGNDLSNRLVS